MDRWIKPVLSTDVLLIRVLLIHFFYVINVLSSLPRSRFLDVTQRFFGGALRDIQKTAARETMFYQSKLH